MKPIRRLLKLAVAVAVGLPAATNAVADDDGFTSMVLHDKTPDGKQVAETFLRYKKGEFIFGRKTSDTNTTGHYVANADGCFLDNTIAKPNEENPFAINKTVFKDGLYRISIHMDKGAAAAGAVDVEATYVDQKWDIKLNGQPYTGGSPLDLSLRYMTDAAICLAVALGDIPPLADDAYANELQPKGPTGMGPGQKPPKSADQPLQYN